MTGKRCPFTFPLTLISGQLIPPSYVKNHSRFEAVFLLTLFWRINSLPFLPQAITSVIHELTRLGHCKHQKRVLGSDPFTYIHSPFLPPLTHVVWLSLLPTLIPPSLPTIPTVSLPPLFTTTSFCSHSICIQPRWILETWEGLEYNACVFFIANGRLAASSPKDLGQHKIQYYGFLS